MEEIKTQNNEKSKDATKQKIAKIILITTIIATIVGLTIICVVGTREKEITQMEFESLDDWSLTFTLFLGLGKEYKSRILINENYFDADTVEILCDNPKIIDVRLGEKGKGYIEYTVTTKYNGEAIIYAQTKDGKVRTSNRKITVWGGSDPVYTDEEKSLISISNGMNIPTKQAQDVYNIFNQVGFSRLESATYIGEDNGLSYYICTTSDLAIDVYMNDNAVSIIKVVDNDDELLLYDLKGGYTKTISNEEYEEFRVKQQNSANKLVREKVASLISIYSAKRRYPDAQEGVDIQITVENKSEKTIKYVVMSFYAKNRVGDIIYCKIRGAKEKKLRMTGPILSGETQRGICECYWYNSAVYYYGFSRFSIEYTDGTIIDFSRQEMDALVYNYNRCNEFYS